MRGHRGFALVVLAAAWQLVPGDTAAAQDAGAAQVAGNPTQKAELDEQQLRDAPAARDVWALLEHRIPAVVTDRLDVGGSDIGNQALFSARSTSWQQNSFRLDGVDTTDPAVRGTSGFYFDYDTFEQLSVSWGTQPASEATAGVAVELVLRSGANEVHGGVQGYFELDALQANNISAELEAQGVQPSSRIDYLSDVSLQAGGPLARDRAWIFGSYRDWRISQFVPRFAEPVTTSLPVLTVKVDAAAGVNDDVSIFGSRQGYRNPARGAGSRIAREATRVEDTTSIVIGGTWSREAGGDGAWRGLQARGSLLDIDFPLLLQAGATRQSQFDIVTRLRTGSAPLAFESGRRRYAADVDARFAAADDAHSILAGGQFQHAPTTNRYTANGDVNIVTSAGAPLVAQLLNTTVTNRQNARALGAYVHDDWAVAPGWALSLGLRYDDWSGSLPAQSSPAGTFDPGRDFSSQSNVLGWRGIAPRLAVSGRLLDDGRLTVLAGFGQYVHQMSAAALSFANPNSLGAATVLWTDTNGDRQFQPGEGGPPVSISGGPVGSVDAGLSAPLTREFRIGAAYALSDTWNAAVDLWYRKDSSLFDDVEVGLTEDDFQTTVVPDPGRDNTEDNGGRGLLVLNQISNFGGNELLLTTVDAKTMTYRGMDIRLERAFAQRWELGAVLTLSITEGLSPKSGPVAGDIGGISDLFNDPNSLVNADGRTFWDRTFVLKAHGAYAFDNGIQIAGVLRSWSGEPLPRILPVALNQGIVDVYAEPRGALRNDALTTADLRVSKQFSVGSGGSVGLYLDAFNVTNAGTVTSTFDTFPLFGIPAAVVPPFVARFGARFAF